MLICLIWKELFTLIHSLPMLVMLSLFFIVMQIKGKHIVRKGVSALPF